MNPVDILVRNLTDKAVEVRLHHQRGLELYEILAIVFSWAKNVSIKEN